MTDIQLDIHQLCKSYSPEKLANDHLDLQVDAGEVFGLLGPNGAGKTTLVKQIIGLLAPTSGSIRLGGRDLVADPQAARQLCSYLPQGSMPIDSLKLREAIEIIGRIRGGDSRSVRDRTQSLIERLELGEWEKTVGAKLSGGARRLAGFAMAIVCPGRLVILDEPTNDIDPLRRRLLWREIRRIAEDGVAVLLVTHNVLEAEQAVDRLAVIDQGKILSQGTPAALKSGDRGELRLQLRLPPGASAPPAPGFALHQLLLGRRLLVQIREKDAARSIEWSRERVDRGEAEEYSLAPTTLEDIYLRLIGRADALETN